MSRTMSPNFCSQCATPLSGRYCSSCGRDSEAGLVGSKHEGWLSLIFDLFPGNAAGHQATSVRGMVRHPGTTATKLALDPDFRGHWAFFLAGIGVHLTAFTLVLPKLATANLKTAYPTADTARLLTAKILAFVSVLIVALVFYYICSVLSSEQRSPRAYLKLVALSFGYWFFLSVVLFAGWFGLSLIVMIVSMLLAPSAGASIAQAIVNAAGTAIYFGSVVVNAAVFNRPFWSFKWSTALGVAIAYLLTAYLLLFPMLTWAAQFSRIEEIMRQFGA